MKKKQHIIWADIARGIGIILVVFAHTIVPQIRESSHEAKFIWIFIYNFHMPLFFFISGWLFENNLNKYTDRTKFILGKLRLLMVPYLTFSLFAYTFIYIAMRIAPLAKVLSSGGYYAVGVTQAVSAIITYSHHADQHLWFVYSLFIVFLINILFKKAMKSPIIIPVLLALYVSKAFLRYPGILDYTADNLLFFSLARIIHSRKGQTAVILTPYRLLPVFTVFIASDIVYSYLYITHMPSGAFKAVIYIIRALCSVSGIITVCSAANMIGGGKNTLRAVFTETGNYSYDIYLMHAPFLVSGSMGILLAYSPLPTAVCIILVTCIGISLPYFLSRAVIRKIPVLSLIILGRDVSQ